MLLDNTSKPSLSAMPSHFPPITLIADSGSSDNYATLDLHLKRRLLVQPPPKKR